MVNLKEQVEASRNKLENCWTGLQNIPSDSILPNTCYEQWKDRASLHQVLKGTSLLFEVREKAYNLIGEVAESIATDPESNPNLIQYNNIEMDFDTARHLVITSYITTTWAIYDRLANVCGRLAGTSDLGNNPRQNPKACEDLLGIENKDGKHKSKEMMGFSVHKKIRDAYAWPLNISYKIRNWLVHEGYELGEITLFKSTDIIDGFILNDDAISFFEKKCNHKSDENGSFYNCCLDGIEECWPTKDLYKILKKYNNEIDAMFASLLKWSVESYELQIKCFTRMTSQ